MPFEYYADLSYASEEQNRKWALIEHRYAAQVSAWVVSGESMVELYLRRNVPVDRIHVLYAGSLPRTAGSVERCLRKRLQIEPASIVLLYQGLIEQKRGIWDVLDVMPFLPSKVHFVVLGFGQNHALQKEVDRRGMQDRVHVVDAVPQKHLLGYTTDADVGIICSKPICESYRHCNPSKLFEYLAAGLPLVVSNLPQLAWYLNKHGLGEVFESGNRQELVRALMRLIQDERYRKSCAENSKRVHETEACWEVQAQKLRDIVVGCLN
jgi:glycosyltransferase involved in cell wall biosynthesis